MQTRRLSLFCRLLSAAYNQPTDWLIANLRNSGTHATPLSKLACLRVIAARTDTTGRPYLDRKAAAKARVWGPK